MLMNRSSPISGANHLGAQVSELSSGSSFKRSHNSSKSEPIASGSQCSRPIDALGYGKRPLRLVGLSSQPSFHLHGFAFRCEPIPQLSLIRKPRSTLGRTSPSKVSSPQSLRAERATPSLIWAGCIRIRLLPVGFLLARRWRLMLRYRRCKGRRSRSPEESSFIAESLRSESSQRTKLPKIRCRVFPALPNAYKYPARLRKSAVSASFPSPFSGL